MSTVVVDCSIALAWSVVSQSSPLTVACERVVSEEGACVPYLFPLEIANALLILERRRKVSRDQVERALTEIELLELDIDSAVIATAHSILTPLARQYQLTLYDAAYLELALRTELPLATRDRALISAAKKAGVQLFTA